MFDKAEIKEAMNSGTFKWLKKNGLIIGCLTWIKTIKDTRLYIYVGNLYITGKYRGRYNLLCLRKFFKHNCNFYYPT